MQSAGFGSDPAQYGLHAARPYNAAAVSEYRANRQPLVEAGKIEHHVADMTVTFAADVPLAALQEVLAAKDQWLPIDGDEQSPVGELVETNSSGPLRLGYGHWRDLLLGAQFYNGLDELITAGGRTVKNVAGYDLTKFMVGQRGVFGRLTTLTVRTYKRPVGAILARFPAQPTIIDRLIPSPAKPQWALLTSSELFVGYVGDAKTLAYYGQALPDYRPASFEKRSLEEDIAHRGELWRGDFRVAVAPSMVSQFLAAARVTQWVADPAFGIILGNLGAGGTDADVIRDVAMRLGGTATINSGTIGAATIGAGDGKSPTRFFDEPPGPRRELLERLKNKLDPQNRLAPLPWQTA